MLKGIVIALVIFGFGNLFADAAMGEKLERQMWSDVKFRNWALVRNRIASNFQSLHNEIVRNRAQEIAILEGLNLSNYIISNVKVTETGNTYIITYLMSIGESIDWNPSSAQISRRLSIWQNNNGTWQWIAHANFTSLPVP